MTLLALGQGIRSRLRRLDGLRGRVTLLLLVAAVPVLVLAVVFAWQNYGMVAGQALERVKVVRATAIARHEAVLGSTIKLLDGLTAAVASRSPTECNGILAQALALQADRYRELLRTDPDGTILCRAGGPDGASPGLETMRIPPAPWLAALRSSDSVAVAEGSGLPGEWPRDRLIVAVPHSGAGGVRSIMIASLAIDWLGELPAVGVPEGLAWLIDDAGNEVSLGGAPANALPPPLVLNQLLGDPVTATPATSRGGNDYVYAVTYLAGHLRLLVGTPASQDISVARAVLARRLAGLGLLLVAGLTAVAFGANRSVVLPIKRLSLAVEAWRAGGSFDPGPPEGMPREVRQLSATFAQATTALADREQQLRLAIEQQGLLMQEIHHRVKNNLQIIASLMNLQASRIRLPEAKREFQSARDRIRALATLHRHLYAHGDVHTINMRSFLHELCDQLLQAIGESAGSRIHLEIDAPELQISSDQAVPMALIVTEAVSNAAKYAFPGGRRGNILVRLTTEGNDARLVIEDDGVGIPDGPVLTESGMRDGIGLQLIRGFARQLGGKLTVTQDRGTRYALDLQIVRERESSVETETLPAVG